MIPSFAIPRIKRGLNRNQMKIRLKRLRAISRALTVQDVRKELQFPGFDPYRVKFYMNIEEGITYLSVNRTNRYPDGRIFIGELSKDAEIVLIAKNIHGRKKARKQKYWDFFRYEEQGEISGVLQRGEEYWGSRKYVDYSPFKMTGLKLEGESVMMPISLTANEIKIFHNEPISKSSVTFDSTLRIAPGLLDDYYFNQDLLRITT